MSVVYDKSTKVRANGDVVVIGHGKSPMGKSWGDKIDECDFVLRLWDWIWQGKIDYGARFDVGLYEISASHMKHFMMCKNRDPVLHWVATVVKQGNYLGPLVVGTELFDVQYWEDFGKSLGAEGVKGKFRFQRGAALTCYAMTKLPIKRCILVGHDNTHAKRALSIEEGHHPRFVNSPTCRHFQHYEAGLTKYGNHDYAMEGEVLSKIAESKGVELVHAQDIW